MTSKPFFPMELHECLMKFEHLQQKYGDSWQSMPTERLWGRLAEEIQELQSARNNHETEAHDELIDITNISLMLLWRRRHD